MDELRSQFLLGLILGLSFMGCAGFSVRYYGLDGMDYSKGMLLGPTQADDLPFVTCAPSETDKSPCVLLTAVDFFKLRQELEETRAKLYSCENDK